MLKVEELSCEYKHNPLGIDVLQPRLSWKIISERSDVQQVAYQIQVAYEEADFDKLVWDTGRLESDQSIHLEYQGEELTAGSRYYYRVRVWDNHGHASEWSEAAYWEMGLLAVSEWQAEWITAPSSLTETAGVNQGVIDTKASYFRREFELQSIKRAKIYVTSLGLYELQLNGQRVGDWLFTPGWTSYNKRLQYQTYDVTSLLETGKNVLGVVLGEGWYKANLAWDDQRNVYGDASALLLQLHIVDEDGKEEIIGTGEEWQTADSPILSSEIYHGEIYDARLEKEGWSSTSYDAVQWQQAVKHNYSKEMLVAQENDPTRMVEEVQPIELITTPNGEKVLDMGQNIVGWLSFKVSGKAGEQVVLEHAEVLDKEGNFYTENLRKAKQRIQYILKGEGEESYQPHFTFQGFRYVKLVEYPGDIKLDNFVGQVIYTDMQQTGSFQCSNELINQLQSNIVWGQKGNFLDVPTDCPQRDERLGWTGDAQVFIRTSAFNMGVASFFTKWLRDLAADQTSSGGVPHVIPHVLNENDHSSSAWGDAAVICPWTIYLCYGDKRILEEQYESMKAWISYIRAQGANEYLWNTGWHFGDWLGLDAEEGSYIGATDKDFIATAFYAYSTQLVAKIAEILEEREDQAYFEQLHQKIKQQFQQEFVTPSGRLAVSTQTAHVLALMFELVEEQHFSRVAASLAQKIEANKFHIATGFVGTPYICLVLSQYGYHDVAAKLAFQEEYPSWLYSVTKGATTIWEHWDGIKPDGSFWSADMNSFNHYAYGAIGDWFYRIVAGIDLDQEQPGYKSIILQPRPVEQLSYAKASLESMYGKIESGWVKKDGRVEYSCSIPPNTLATIKLSGARLDHLLIAGQESLSSQEGIKEWKETEDGVVIEIGSGEYHFSY